MIASSHLSTPIATKLPIEANYHTLVNEIEFWSIVDALQYLTFTRPNITHAEAEYRALASTSAEITWISYLLLDLGIPLFQPPQLFSNNNSALHMTINPILHV